MGLSDVLENGGSFLLFFVMELFRLMLVIAGAALGGDFFGGRLGSMRAHDVPLAIGFFGVYALFALRPARDLVQGWFGLFSGQLPDPFVEGPENFGRGVCDVAFFVLSVIFLIRTFPHGHVAEAGKEALVFAFLLFASLVFGLGTGLVRLAFGFGLDAHFFGEDRPEQLKRVGRRAQIFVYCAFLGIGFGLSGANVAARMNPSARPPNPHARAMARAPRTSGLVSGVLCRTPTADCPKDIHVDVSTLDTEPMLVEYSSEGSEAKCWIEGDDDWPAPAHWTHAMENALDAEGLEGDEILLDAPPGAQLGFVFLLPSGADKCSYFLELGEPKPVKGQGKQP